MSCLMASLFCCVLYARSDLAYLSRKGAGDYHKALQEVDREFHIKKHLEIRNA